MLEAIPYAGFGLIIGSFLNVLILRAGVRSLGGRSECFSCSAQIKWYDNIPVLSWLILRGRCRMCKSRISPQYIAIEILTSVLFVIIGLAALQPLQTAVSFAIVSLLIAIGTYDLRHTIIPDAWVWSFTGLALVIAYTRVFDPSDYLFVLFGAIAAALPLFMLWLVSSGRWMGFGDVKLALGIGILLGPVFGFYALVLGFVLGAIISVAILLPLPHIMSFFARAGIARLSQRHSRFTMKSEVPFGPFLIAACCIVWFSTLYNISLPLLP